jgi:hypothetical protein
MNSPLCPSNHRTAFLCLKFPLALTYGIQADKSVCSPIQHLDNSHSYCFDRGNGEYTRLIPADSLPSLVLTSMNIAPRQHNPDGMMILPIPRAQPPEAFGEGVGHGVMVGQASNPVRLRVQRSGVFGKRKVEN